jgi:hypothetical protein
MPRVTSLPRRYISFAKREKIRQEKYKCSQELEV